MVECSWGEGGGFRSERVEVTVGGGGGGGAREKEGSREEVGRGAREKA